MIILRISMIVKDLFITMPPPFTYKLYFYISNTLFHLNPSTLIWPGNQLIVAS